MGISLVPSYGCAYLRAGTAEKARNEARGAGGFDSPEREQSRLALRPASRVIEAAIAIRGREGLGDCDQTSSSVHQLEEGFEVLEVRRSPLALDNDVHIQISSDELKLGLQ